MGVEAESIEDLPFDVEESVAVGNVGAFGQVVGFWVWWICGCRGGERGRWREKVGVDVCYAAEGSR